MPTSASLALKLAAAGEAGTGLALLLAPTWVIALLLGGEASTVTVMVARVLGIALLALAWACWPGPPRQGMLVYGVAVAAYLGWLGWTGAASGWLLWPAVLLHGVLALALIGERRRHGP